MGLLDATVLIDGIEYIVKGVETYRILLYPTPEIMPVGHPIGLLVKPA